MIKNLKINYKTSQLHNSYNFLYVKILYKLYKLIYRVIIDFRNGNLNLITNYEEKTKKNNSS
jgi:hypothetical protein